MTERDWRIFREDFNISYKVRRYSQVLKALELVSSEGTNVCKQCWPQSI